MSRYVQAPRPDVSGVVVRVDDNRISSTRPRESTGGYRGGRGHRCSRLVGVDTAVGAQAPDEDP